MRRSKHYFINLIVPASVFGSVTGILTAIVVIVYKLCAKYVISFSETSYAYLRGHLYFLPLVLLVLLGFAYLSAWVYQKIPNLRGGGIPTSIGILRGIITFKWLRNLVGVFLLSLSSFFIGLPLGNEGPSVQMGTAIGRGSVFSFAKKQRAWDRYSMTGGACAGFSVATGAPISGIMFAIEEAHQRISPMIVIVSCTSVVFSYITSELLSPLLGVSTTLFPEMELVALSVRDLWIPLVIGLAVGFFAVLFFNYYRVINRFFNKTLGKLPHCYRIFSVMLVTVLLGLVSYSFISTGHELIDLLFEGKLAVYMMIFILVARATLTLSANSNGITGGMFLPILALGALLSSMLGKGMMALFGLSHDYYVMILILGITACISGMMKTPLTAIVFAVEALSCYKNILFVVVVAVIAFAIAEVCGASSINDSVLETRAEEQNHGKTAKVFDTFVTVQPHAFAVGKQIRDIFWPTNLFVLSLKHAKKEGAEVDEHGGKAIHEGDVLHVRYSTFDEDATREELFAIVGAQDFDRAETDVI